MTALKFLNKTMMQTRIRDVDIPSELKELIEKDISSDEDFDGFN